MNVDQLAHFLTYLFAGVSSCVMFCAGLACLWYALQLTVQRLGALLLGLAMTLLPVAGVVSLYLAPPAPAPSPIPPGPNPNPLPIPPTPHPNTPFASAVAQAFQGTKTDAAAVAHLAGLMAADVAIDGTKNVPVVNNTNDVGAHFAALRTASSADFARFPALGTVVGSEQRNRGITNGTNQTMTPQLRATVVQFYSDWSDAMQGLGQ
jgi:hypothetical protein